MPAQAAAAPKVAAHAPAPAHAHAPAAAAKHAGAQFQAHAPKHAAAMLAFAPGTSKEDRFLGSTGIHQRGECGWRRQ